MSTAALAHIREDLKARMDEATRKSNVGLLLLFSSLFRLIPSLQNETVPWYSRVVKTFGSDDSNYAFSLCLYNFSDFGSSFSRNSGT